MSMVTNSAGSVEVAVAGSTMPIASYLAVASAAGIQASVTSAPQAASIVTGTTGPSAQELIVGTQTLALSKPITLGSGASASVISMVTNSAGSAEVAVAGSTMPIASYLAVASAAGIQASVTNAPQAKSTVTGAKVYVTVGVLTVSQASNGAYMIGSLTLQPGSSITQGTGSATQVVALQVSGTITQVVVAGASTTSTAALTKITPAPSLSASNAFSFSAAQPTTTLSSSVVPEVILNGQTFTINGATLGAVATGPTSTASAAATASTAHPKLASGASGMHGWSTFLATMAVAVGTIALF